MSLARMNVLQSTLRRTRLSQGVVVLASISGCGGTPNSATDPAAPVVRHYAVMLEANYADTVTTLEALSLRVDEFLSDPTADGLILVRQAWLDAREPYGEAEVSRFYGGPMDAAQGAMNEWPIDENYIDYTAGNSEGGIINDAQQFPDITPGLLASLAGRGGTENYSTGFHAIEFLLWGQRLDQTKGPGERPYTDFVDGGTGRNQLRRRTYLRTTTLMLLESMRSVAAEWDLTDPKGYGAKFIGGSPLDSLSRIYRGFSQMAVSETFYERLSNPFRSRDRKDEQSCFSESTLSDLESNALGIENVYLGRYGKLGGPSLADLVKAKNPDLDGRLRRALERIRAAIAAIPPPLDHAILSDPSSEPHARVSEAVDAFAPLLDLLHEAAGTLGVTNNL
jgi:putative iron-regulated protein